MQLQKSTQFTTESIPCITATNVFQTLAGSSDAKIMRASDGKFYAVKFSCNPYGPRILTNEFLAWRLARLLGLPTPRIALISVPPELGTPGLHFASRLFRRAGAGHDPNARPEWSLVQNANDLWGAFVFDLWTGNADARQFIYLRAPGTRPFRVMLIDHGHCFGGPAWRILDFLSIPNPSLLAYASLSGWADLKPWLLRLESLSPERILQIRDGVPPSWLGGTGAGALNVLLANLISRCAAVRQLITGMIVQRTQPFATWRMGRDGGWRPSRWLKATKVA